MISWSIFAPILTLLVGLLVGGAAFKLELLGLDGSENPKKKPWVVALFLLTGVASLLVYLQGCNEAAEAKETKRLYGKQVDQINSLSNQLFRVQSERSEQVTILTERLAIAEEQRLSSLLTLSNQNAVTSEVLGRLPQFKVASFNTNFFSKVEVLDGGVFHPWQPKWQERLVKLTNSQPIEIHLKNIGSRPCKGLKVGIKLNVPNDSEELSIEFPNAKKMGRTYWLMLDQIFPNDENYSFGLGKMKYKVSKRVYVSMLITIHNEFGSERYVGYFELNP